MEIKERFLNYVSFDTQSVENSQTVPSTSKQLKLGKYLVEELQSLGIENAKIDEYGVVYGTIPSNNNHQGDVIGFIAHMDTSPDASGKDIHPQIIKNYQGQKITLNEDKKLYLDPEQYPQLLHLIHHDLITTDGTTLLGADDKAGIAIIMQMVEYIYNHPEFKHNDIQITFTPDEEIGHGSDHFNVDYFNAQYAYTIDGGDIHIVEYENFNAFSAKVKVHGRSIHPGSAKNKMINSTRVAYEFEGKLLGKLRAAFEEFSAEVSQFIGVLLVSMDAAEKRIADRNKNTKGIADLSSAIVEVSEDEKMLKLEQALILDKNQQETWSGNIRKAITGNRNYAHFSELAATTSEDAIFDIFDTELSPKIREKHDQDYQNDKILGLNVLQQLQKVLLTDTDIRNFASTVINQSGTFLKLDDGQLSKALNNNENPVSHPESINRKTILISMPTDEGNDSLKAFSNKLKAALQGAFGNATPGSTINFNTSSDRMNEITVISIRYCFPMRAIAWLPSYDRAYNDMVNNKNELAAKEARILLHSEGDGTELPDLMGEKKVSPKDFIPYFFVAAANNILAVRENEREEKGWCIVTADEWGAEMVTLIASQFTELLTSEDLTEEVLDTIKEKVDEVLKNPDLKMSDRAAMVEGVKVVMRDYVSKECSSPTSPKYQQYSAEAKKALELINTL